MDIIGSIKGIISFCLFLSYVSGTLGNCSKVYRSKDFLNERTFTFQQGRYSSHSGNTSLSTFID